MSDILKFIGIFISALLFVLSATFFSSLLELEKGESININIIRK
jgi:hypothetical protein